MTNLNRTYVLNAFVNTPWAILPSKLSLLQEIVARHVNGEKLSAEEIQANIQGATPVRDGSNPQPKVGILRVFGTIFPRSHLMTEMSGGTNAESLGRIFDAMVADSNISAIVLDVDSPGGQVNGIAELSEKIFNARGVKPIIAIANHTMASAAYWIGSSADEIVVAPSGAVGSIGVFAAHTDYSGYLEKEGMNVTLISQGKYKVEGNPYQPLGDEAKAMIEERVKESYIAFTEAVARNRAVTASSVREGFGEGRMVEGKKAIEAGMADRIATLDETIKSLLATTVEKFQINSTQALSPVIEEQAITSEAESSEQPQSGNGLRKEFNRAYVKVFTQ